MLNIIDPMTTISRAVDAMFGAPEIARMPSGEIVAACIDATIRDHPLIATAAWRPQFA